MTDLYVIRDIKNIVGSVVIHRNDGSWYTRPAFGYKTKFNDPENMEVLMVGPGAELTWYPIKTDDFQMKLVSQEK